MSDDFDRLCIELHRLEWARNLDRQVIEEIATCGHGATYRAGQVVIELDQQIERAYFILSGRLDLTMYDQIGKEIRCDCFRRGSVVGLFAMLLGDRSYLHVEAVEDTVVLALSCDELLHLTAKHREFQIAMFHAAAEVVRRLVVANRDLPKPPVVGIAHHSDASRPLTLDLVRRLSQLGESPCVAGDDERWKPDGSIPHCLLFENGSPIDPAQIKRSLEEWRAHDRLFVDFRADQTLDVLRRVAGYSDLVLWCLRPQDADAALQTLKDLESSVPGLRAKIALVWILDPQNPTPPYSADLYRLAVRDFKIYRGELGQGRGRLMHQGVERVVRYLRGVQIGLALGGGAARGMAHLGVLRALERHGIYVDMLAGTSAGAMVGGIYTAGFDPEFSTSCFKNDLLPNWFFRHIPGGGYWYLLYKYRFRQFGPMLRKYLEELQMEQLMIPTLMVSVDLCDGALLVRDSGDATNNILESINLPPLSLPIVQADQAVVDGGLLNNVPADALLAKGCNFVIASTVTAKLEQDFMGIRSKNGHRKSRFTASLQVILRQTMIQSYSMNAVGVKPADFIVAPDVTSFDISEFTRADEMAVVGDAAVESSIQQLKTMLSKLDGRLFAS